MARHIFTSGCLFSILLCGFLNQAAAQEKLRNSTDDSVAKLMPSSVIGYLHVPRTEQLLNSILDHPLRKQIEEIEDVEKALKSNEFKQVNVLRRVIEYQLEMKWDEAVDQLTRNGLYLAFDAKSNSFAVIAHAKDENSLQSIVDKMIELINDSEKMQVPLKLIKNDYRGITAYEINKVIFALLDDKLLIASNSKLAKKIVDQWKDGDDMSLADSQQFQEAQKNAMNDNSARLYLDVEKIRASGLAKELFAKKTENIGLEVILGGIQSNLRKTPFAVVDLKLKDDDLSISAITKHDDQWVSEPREFFFGKNGNGQPPQQIVPTNAIFNMTTYRDIAGLWLAKEDLFGEKHIAELAQADTQFSTIISGLDFGEEILGATKPGVQIVAALQDFAKIETPQPDIKLPAFAFIFQLKEPAKIQRRFKVGFQSVIGFMNIALSQQGQPQLDIDTEKFKDGQIVTTSYLVEDENKEDGLINYNFSPTVAFVGDHLIISSTGTLARELVEKARAGGKPNDKDVNTLAKLDAKQLRQILQANRESLIAQNMLEQGSDRAEASKRIDQFLGLLDSTKNASFRLFNHHDKLELKIELDFEKSKK